MCVCAWNAHPPLALVAQDLQSFQVRQTLIIIKQDAVMSRGFTHRLAAQPLARLLFGFLQHLHNTLRWGYWRARSLEMSFFARPPPPLPKQTHLEYLRERDGPLHEDFGLLKSRVALRQHGHRLPADELQRIESSGQHRLPLRDRKSDSWLKIIEGKTHGSCTSLTFNLWEWPRKNEYATECMNNSWLCDAYVCFLFNVK